MRPCARESRRRRQSQMSPNGTHRSSPPWRRDNNVQACQLIDLASAGSSSAERSSSGVVRIAEDRLRDGDGDGEDHVFDADIGIMWPRRDKVVTPGKPVWRGRRCGADAVATAIRTGRVSRPTPSMLWLVNFVGVRMFPGGQQQYVVRPRTRSARTFQPLLMRIARPARIGTHIHKLGRSRERSALWLDASGSPAAHARCSGLPQVSTLHDWKLDLYHKVSMRSYYEGTQGLFF